MWLLICRFRRRWRRACVCVCTHCAAPLYTVVTTACYTRTLWGYGCVWMSLKRRISRDGAGAGSGRQHRGGVAERAPCAASARSGGALQRCSKRLTRRFGARSLTSDFLISVAKVLPPARACKWQICRRWHARCSDRGRRPEQPPARRKIFNIYIKYYLRVRVAHGLLQLYIHVYIYAYRRSAAAAALRISTLTRRRRRRRWPLLSHTL